MNFHKKYIKICLIALSLICISFGINEGIKFRAKIDTDYDALFTRTKGWTGGDIAHTVPLSDSMTLWLFGDTWIGKVKNNRHVNSKMISNSVAIQYGKAANKKNLRFYYKTIDGKPAPLFTPDDGNGQFWLDRGGIKAKNGLYLLASQIVKLENDNSVSGWKSIGNWILKIDNAIDEPDKWSYKTFRIPFFLNTDETQIDFGIPQFIKDGHIYIYGCEFLKKENERYMLLARVPEGQILNFEAWEFFSKGQWEKEFRNADRLCNHFGAEYSVSYHPFLNKYITVYTELGESEKIMLRTSANPEGPWSEQVEVYRAPEPNWSRNYFCYAGRSHIELSGSKDLLISYACNSWDFWEMAADARIYRPRFIRIQFEDNQVMKTD
jgi:hypothetical protein